MEKNDTIYNIFRAPVDGQMKWQILHPDTDVMLAFSETYDGAVRCAREIGNEAKDIPGALISEHYNFDHLGKVLAERARIHFGR